MTAPVRRHGPPADVACTCAHPRSRHFGPRNAGPCDAACGCTGFSEARSRALR